MNRLESQALSSGLKISKPSAPEAFWPLPFEKYITVNTFGKYSSRNYLYFTEALNIITNDLKENNIHVVQLGTANDPQIHSKVFGLNGVLTIPQSSYVIKNSLAHLGCDGFLNHLAASFDVPLVALYGDTLSSQAKPLWGNSKKQIHIDGSKGKNPSYSQTDGKTQNINSIKPELIAKSILNLLGIKNNLHNYKTKYIGKAYHFPVVDIVPDHPFNNAPQNVPVNIRADYNLHPEYFKNCLAGRRGNIVTINSEINPNIFAAFKSNIEMINFELNESTNESFVDDLYNTGNKVQLTCKNQDILRDLRLKFIDYPIQDISTEKPPSKISKNIKKLKIKSSKEIFSKGSVFPSKFHYYESLGQSNLDYLWDDLDHLIFYSEK